jgi:hypothetical protein
MIIPMFLMVLLTFVVGASTLLSRVKSVQSGDLKMSYFRTMQGDAPDFVIRSTRCFNNQFEVPVLFYVIGTLSVVLGLETSLSLTFAWAFVLFRTAHAVIHLTYNNVFHRLTFFWLAVMSVLSLWIEFLVQYY